MLKTDESFCKSGNGQVRRLMEVRRRHGECKVGERGCEIVRGWDCGGRRKQGRQGLWMAVRREWGRNEGKSWWMMWVVSLLAASLGVNLWMLWRHHVDDETIL